MLADYEALPPGFCWCEPWAEPGVRRGAVDTDLEVLTLSPVLEQRRAARGGVSMTLVPLAAHPLLRALRRFILDDQDPAEVAFRCLSGELLSACVALGRMCGEDALIALLRASGCVLREPPAT